MTLTELKEIDRHYRAIKPKLFLLSTPDRCAHDSDIANVEAKLGLSLPTRYRDVLQAFGGGLIGFINLFSADPQSDYFLPSRVKETSQYLPSGLLPFSDDYAGGLYVFKICEGVTNEVVYYWNADGGLVQTQFKDVMEFIAQLAYEPSKRS